MHTTEQAAELGPTPRPSKPWLRRGWGAGGDNARGRGPPQTREGSDKQPSVQREDRGEWRERSLRIKQLEGALIYPSTGGKWGEGQSKLRREDGRNFTGKNLPMNFFFFFGFSVSFGQTYRGKLIKMIQIFSYTKGKTRPTLRNLYVKKNASPFLFLRD